MHVWPRQLGEGKGLCKIDFPKNKCILSCTQIFLCTNKQGLAKNQKTSGLWNKLELIHSCLPIQITLQTSLAALQHGQSSKYLSVVRLPKHAEWRWPQRSLAKHASLSVANLTLNLLRSTWSSFSFPFWLYSRQTSFLKYGFIRVLSQTLRMGVVSFPYIRSVASSILFYVAFYQLHMPSQDVIPHHPCSGLANEPFLKYLKTVQKTLEICPPLQTVTLINI
jgi:hypothetical protein